MAIKTDWSQISSFMIMQLENAENSHLIPSHWFMTTNAAKHLVRLLPQYQYKLLHEIEVPDEMYGYPVVIDETLEGVGVALQFNNADQLSTKGNA